MTLDRKNVLFIVLDFFNIIYDEKGHMLTKALLNTLGWQEKINYKILILQNNLLDYCNDVQYTDKDNNPLLVNYYINTEMLSQYDFIKSVLLENIDDIENNWDYVVVLDSHTLFNTRNQLLIYDLTNELDNADKKILAFNFESDVHGLCLETILSFIIYDKNEFIRVFKNFPKIVDCCDITRFTNYMKTSTVVHAKIKKIKSDENSEIRVNHSLMFHNILYSLCLNKLYPGYESIPEKELPDNISNYSMSTLLFNSKKYSRLLNNYPFEYTSMVNRYTTIGNIELNGILERYNIDKISDLYTTIGTGLIAL